MKGEQSERALIFAPSGRDAQVASGILAEGGMSASICDELPALVHCLERELAALLSVVELLRAEAQPGPGRAGVVCARC